MGSLTKSAGCCKGLISLCVKRAGTCVIWEKIPIAHDDVIKWNIFALLTLCEGNPLVTGGFPPHRPMTRNFDILFDFRLNKPLNKQSNRDASDLRRHGVHYNVTVIKVIRSVRYRGYFMHSPSRWRTALQCNVVSNGLGSFTKWSLKG